MTNIIQAQYDELENIASRFIQQAEANTAMLGRVQRVVSQLQNGGWIGEGATAFFNEMDSDVVPAMNRLTDALEQASSVTLQMSEVVRTAEEEAAALFKETNNDVITSKPSNTMISDDDFLIGSSRPFPTPSQDKKTIWDNFEFDNQFDIWSKELGEKGKFDPELKLTFGTDESSIWGNPEEGWSAIGGKAEAGLIFSKDQVLIGGGGEFYTVKGEWDTTFIGNEEYGLTGGIGVKGPSADGFFGLRIDKDGPAFGGNVGVSIVSVDGELGGNVAGHNVSVTGEVGLKAELGITFGRKTEVKLPFVSFGLKFG